MAKEPQIKLSQTSRPIDEEWQSWIAENLLLGVDPDDLIEKMIANGFAESTAEAEIDLAQQSPYLRASQKLSNRLKKRDWLLTVFRKGRRMHPLSGVIERKHKLSRKEFFEDYYSPSRPVIITGMMDDWPAMKKWDLDFFATQFGNREIEVQTGRDANANYEIDREATRMKFSDLIENIRTAGPTNDFYMTANNESFNKRTLPELWKDIIQIPEYLDGRNRMNGFFWLGPKGTITPFHHDLTNNFMAQVTGRKRVMIAPSWDIPLMQNHYHVYSQVDGRVTPPNPTPALHQPQILECILSPGEILFLPIGCLHFVEGLDISVTISFTNFLSDNDFNSFYTTYHDV